MARITFEILSTFAPQSESRIKKSFFV